MWILIWLCHPSCVLAKFISYSQIFRPLYLLKISAIIYVEHLVVEYKLTKWQALCIKVWPLSWSAPSDGLPNSVPTATCWWPHMQALLSGTHRVLCRCLTFSAHPAMPCAFPSTQGRSDCEETDCAPKGTILNSVRVHFLQRLFSFFVRSFTLEYTFSEICF